MLTIFCRYYKIYVVAVKMSIKSQKIGGKSMKWKQMLAIGLSAVTIMSAVQGEGIRVYAGTKTEVQNKETKKTLAKAAVTASEYGSVVDSETISDETSKTEITWTVYDSGKLVIEGTGVTPDWSPWFNYKEDITDVIIGDGITALGERNFMNYPTLKTVTVKGNLSKIGNSAFEGCTALRSVKVKESTMIMLGEYTFLNCTALTDADLPGSKMKSIGSKAFWGCTSLNKFDFSDVSRIQDFAFANCSSFENITIPSTWNTIAEGAFYGCSGLKNIDIPENIKTIGKNAFQGCSGIKTLKIPGTVTEIGKWAFSNCTGLEEFDIEEGVQTIGDLAFAGCENLKTMILPKSVSQFPDKFVTD